MWYIIGMVVLALTPGPGLGAQATDAEQPPTVETVGVGERRIAPDRASVMLVVASKAPTASAAAAANSRAVAAVRDTLARLGLDTIVTTASYHVGANYEPGVRGERQQAGYIARTTLRIPLRRIDDAGRVIDAGLARGGTGVDAIWFESSMAEEARRAAMADGAAAARRDAESLARALGGTLGPLVAVSTVGPADPRRVMAAGGVSEMSYRSTQITPNEIVVRAAVHTRWRFVPR